MKRTFFRRLPPPHRREFSLPEELSRETFAGTLRGLLAASILLALLAPAAGAQQCDPIWADEFDGNTLDASKWSHQTGDGCPDLCGWGNNELEYYQEDNARVGGGTLKIIAREEQVGGQNYTSARLRTLDQGDWTYGRFEARIKLPEGQGIWPAFWMLPTDEVYGGWPTSGEIDIMEYVGQTPDEVFGTIHFGNAWPNNSFQGTPYILHEGKFSDDFHTFAVEREPGLIRWLVDDVPYAVKRTADVGDLIWPFEERFHFLLNVAVGGNLPGNPDASTTFPQQMEVDYVRVYENSRPRLEGPRRVLRGELGVTFEILSQDPGTTYSWETPAGVQSISGKQGRKLTVNWGSKSGTVAVEVSSSCETRRYELAVEVDEPQRDLTMPNQLALEILTPSRVLAEWNDRSTEETTFELIGKTDGVWRKIASAGGDVERAVSLPLTPEARYEVRVRARNGARVSAWSPKRIVVMPEEMPRPTQFNAEGLSPTSFRLSWKDQSSDELDFEIDRRRIPGGLWEPAAVTPADAESVVLLDLEAGATYLFRLRARKDGGLSEWRRKQATLPASIF